MVCFQLHRPSRYKLTNDAVECPISPFRLQKGAHKRPLCALTALNHFKMVSSAVSNPKHNVIVGNEQQKSDRAKDRNKLNNNGLQTLAFKLYL